MCYSSASQKIVELTEEKKSLVALQEELVRQELMQSKETHKLKIEHMKAEHELRMLILQNEYANSSK